MTSDDPGNKGVLSRITEAVGEPKNYGPTAAERAEEARRLAAAQLQARALAAVEKRRRDEVELGEMALQDKEWVSREQSLHQ